VLALAVETGSPAALALEGSSLPVALALLGRFELTDGGRALPLGSGQAAQLVKLVAVRGDLDEARRMSSGRSSSRLTTTTAI